MTSTTLVPLNADTYVVRADYGSTLGRVTRVQRPLAADAAWLAMTSGGGTRYVESPKQGAEFIADPVAFATR